MRLAALTFVAALPSCASSGPYGHSRVYAPLAAEEAAVQGAAEYDPVMAQRSPDQWKGRAITLFGVVLSRTPAKAGNADLQLSVRTLEPRNLCDSTDDDSCRVTVSDHEHALVHARVRLTSEDDLGEHSVGPRSLLRIVGTLTDAVDSSDGAPVLETKYYRHWPRGFYVTTADRGVMRQ